MSTVDTNYQYTISYHYQRTAITKKRPIMLGYQAAGAAPLVNKEIVNNPETIATAIRIGNPQSFRVSEKGQRRFGELVLKV